MTTNIKRNEDISYEEAFDKIKNDEWSLIEFKEWFSDKANSQEFDENWNSRNC
jgi:hypothetical protein